MDARTETYTKLPSSRQSRMKIDSLLNPPSNPADRDRERDYHPPGSPYTQHATMSSTSHSSGYAHSPGYPPSPSGYWYPRYQGYHDVSPGAASTATTHASSSSGASANMNHHQHHHHHSQAHHHHTFLPYHPSGSTHSSPDPYHPRERYDSVSSSSSTNGGGGPDRRRPPRPKYEEEEMYFIWYHRVDLCQEWKEVRESFNRQFPSRQRRGFQGIQCKFYRFIKDKKCPTLREQRRMRDGDFLREGATVGGGESGKPKFGVVEWSEGKVWYPWMREDRETLIRRQQRQQRASA